APDEVDAISRSKHGLHAPRPATTDHAGMAAMRLRHHLKDDAGFAVLLCPEDDTFVAPFHRRSLPPMAARIQAACVSVEIRAPSRGNVPGRHPSFREP